MHHFLSILRAFDNFPTRLFPQVVYSDTVVTLPDINDRSLVVLRKALAVTDGWEVVGPCCEKCGSYTISVSSTWKCVQRGCDYSKSVVGSATITSRGILGKTLPMPHVMPDPVLQNARELRKAEKTLPVYPPISTGVAAVNRFYESLKKSRIAMMYGGQEVAKKIEGEMLADVAKAEQEKAKLIQQISELNKKLEEASQNKADLAELLKGTDRLLRAVAGINYQDHTVAEQREIRDSVRAVMAAIAKVDLTKRAE